MIEFVTNEPVMEKGFLWDFLQDSKQENNVDFM